jgi:Arc/MetJ family transcription regulator
MKTTIDTADGLVKDARRTAQREGTTLRALVEDGLRRILGERAQRSADRDFGRFPELTVRNPLMNPPL